MNITEKISVLRTKIRDNNVDAFIVFSADPHMSEYLPHEWQERAWVSGFTSSAGFVVQLRSEERRVGKECRSRWSPYH